MLKTKEQIKNWLDEYYFYDYTINDDLTVDADRGIWLADKDLTEIPVQFNVVNGYFFCSDNRLTSLIGSPREVGGRFYCNNNKLTTLEGSPEVVNSHFICVKNKLKSLKGCPKRVGGELYFRYKIPLVSGSSSKFGLFKTLKYIFMGKNKIIAKYGGYIEKDVFKKYAISEKYS